MSDGPKHERRERRKPGGGADRDEPGGPAPGADVPMGYGGGEDDGGAYEAISLEGDEDETEEESEATVPGGRGPPRHADELGLSHEALAALAAGGDFAERDEDTATRTAGRATSSDALRDLEILESGSRDDRVTEAAAPNEDEIRVTFADASPGRRDAPADEEETTRRFSPPASSPRSTVRDAALSSSHGIPAAVSGEIDLEAGDGGGRESGGLEAVGMEIDGLRIEGLEPDGGEGDEEKTRERTPDAHRGDLDLDLDLGPDPAADPASDAPPDPASAANSAPDPGPVADPVPPLELEPSGGESGEPDPAGAGATDPVAIRAGLAAAIDRAAPAGEAEDARTRRRIRWLVERAGEASRAGRHTAAVVAAELAFVEKPDSAAAQKLIHEHSRDLLSAYEQFLDDRGKVPRPGLPMHELPLQDLDSRAAFLLSRIDGMLSCEELLDVSGMPRLEACRYLGRMVLQGLVELR